MKNFNLFSFKNIIKYAFFGLGLVPCSLYAATATSETVFGGLGSMINSFNTSVVKAVGTLFMTSAVVVFFYGLVKFILAKSNGTTGEIKTGQSFMAWGLLALFVMFSVWGIISFFGKSLGIATGGAITVPSLDFDLKNSNSGTSNTNNTTNNSSLPTAPSSPQNSQESTCRAASNIWYNGKCMTSQDYCRAVGGVWHNETCMSSQEYSASLGNFAP